MIFVSTACLLGGGVFIIDKSLAPSKENCKVLGIGVALNVRVSIFSFKYLIFSLIFTPNFCSSSIIKSPRSRNSISFPTILCVPIKISIFPVLDFLLYFFVLFLI